MKTQKMPKADRLSAYMSACNLVYLCEILLNEAANDDEARLALRHLVVAYDKRARALINNQMPAEMPAAN